MLNLAKYEVHGEDHMSSMWMVRAGKRCSFFDTFKNEGVVAIGHGYLGDLTDIRDKKTIRRKFREQTVREFTKGQIDIRVEKIYHFLLSMSVDDWIITYNSKDREYLVGRIVSDYKYKPGFIDYPNIREVKWNASVKKDNLSKATQRHLRYPQAIFLVNEVAADEILNLLNF